MILPDTFHFLRPAWLAALVPLAAILWLMVRRRLRGGSWAAVCDPALLPHVLIGGQGPARSLPTVLTALAGTLAILALAGPVWRQLPQPVYSGGNALVIAMDLSRSMDAGDLQPSRLVRARFRLADILALRREGQTALLAFAGDAFTVTPLTDDVETIRSQLGALSTDIMPAQGSRGDKALMLAGDLLRQAGLSQGDILLVTDEISALRGVEAARALRDSGFRVSVLGVGTERGAPIPAGDGGFLKSDAGEIVIPRLDESVLREVAAAGGGQYAQLAIDNSDLETLADVLTGAAAATEPARTSFHADVWREEGPWLVLLLLPLAALAFRRGYLLVLPLVLFIPPRPAQAFEWKDLWLRPDQQGQHALESGDAARAATLFEDPERKGAAQYRADDYQSAVDTLAGADTADALYNRGNALARLNRFDEAIAAYDEVLRRDPAHEDAAFNKALLEEQKPPPPQSGSGESPPEPQSGNQQQPDSGAQSGADADADAQPGDKQSGESGQDQQAEADADAEGDTEDEKPASPEESGAAESTAETSPEDGDNRQPAQADDSATEGNEQLAQAGADSELPDEEQLAAEQWLRRIPDDPGGLLRRKFRYQYQQRARGHQPEEQVW